MEEERETRKYEIFVLISKDGKFDTQNEVSLPVSGNLVLKMLNAEQK